ncbi:protein kinase [Sorangium cellulosum]|uniref:non-specific serine/threonine protein kinase n=1 Tax=Sorangium cellulosum TaxID=56 RepID=A0A4P2Q1U1_SORCE|nr:serine/threonine-protein kinase [Sorangium cellulosum]AUX23190.1 protein kinase [Sorangium cellulosum]
MRAGTIVGDRFEIERLAGSGGMGDVYRARDRWSGDTVAIKILRRSGEMESSRFLREVRALAALQSPGIVRYIADGVTGAQEMYLAMEWLSGETLSQRLSRAELTIAESLALGARIAAALGVVHREGIVHRDLKPSNIFLAGGAAERVTLIDFGIARVSGVEQRLTATGAMLGTPGYMAPEQARGEPNVDARADVFSLGCVLFKCLTGRAPFLGLDPLSVALKIVLEEPPRLRELRPELPAAVDALIARMLAKLPDRRPRDGDAVAAELAALSERLLEWPSASSMSARSREITSSERRIVSLVLARDAVTQGAPAAQAPELERRARALRAVAERYQGQLEILADQSPVVVLSSAGAPTDLAARAARCALSLRAVLGRAPVALVSGRAELSPRAPVGELIDRAVLLLAADRGAAGAAPILLDSVTAGLLGGRFDVAPAGAAHCLRGERDDLDAPPLLLGKPTACVGREREIALLETAFVQCVEESLASAAIVVGPAGSGKSRLRYELIQRLRARGDGAQVWIGRGDPMRAGSAFGLLAQALRRAIGLFDDEPLAARRQKIRARIDQRGVKDGARVAAFLGEMVGARFPDDDDVRLRAARRNPVLMNDQLRVAWEDFLRAECARGPVVLVLEDLQWGDLPTVTLVDGALRNLRELPLLVLALGRPEVRETFRDLWTSHGALEVRLATLPRRASERLVRQALGQDASDTLVQALVERADGNAFYLEEQIRAVAEGKGAGVPETVLVMVQARLEALDLEMRRALRAASIFGETFWRGGVAALMGGADATRPLEMLEQRELIVGGRGESLAGEVEYSFRHALIQEAAYGMLTERDRELGHWLAGEWLERAGEADAALLAEHFERGGDPGRAVVFYERAAEQALRGNDLVATLDLAERGVRCGATGELLGALRLVQAEAHVWRGEFAQGEQRGVEAAEQLHPGSAPWFRAVQQSAVAAGKQGYYDRVERWASRATAEPPDEGAESARLACLAECAGFVAFGGNYAAANALIEELSRGVSQQSAPDPELVGRLYYARSVGLLASGSLGDCLECTEASLAAFERAGDRRNACVARNNLGSFYAELGAFDRAEEALRTSMAEAERMGLHDPAMLALANLGHVLAYRGQLAEAKRALRRAIEAEERQGDPRAAGTSRTYLAEAALLSGELDAAERDARAAAAALDVVPPLRAAALAVGAQALLGLGRAGEALAAAEEAMSLLLSLGTVEEGESRVRLAYAESLAANGKQAEATAAIVAARERLLARAERVGAPAWRERFLAREENARTLALADQWTGEPA